jgi:hypothetical protein
MSDQMLARKMVNTNSVTRVLIERQRHPWYFMSSALH